MMLILAGLITLNFTHSAYAVNSIYGDPTTPNLSSTSGTIERDSILGSVPMKARGKLLAVYENPGLLHHRVLWVVDEFTPVATETISEFGLTYYKLPAGGLATFGFGPEISGAFTTLPIFLGHGYITPLKLISAQSFPDSTDEFVLTYRFSVKFKGPPSFLPNGFKYVEHPGASFRLVVRYKNCENGYFLDNESISEIESPPVAGFGILPNLGSSVSARIFSDAFGFSEGWRGNGVSALVADKIGDWFRRGARDVTDSTNLTDSNPFGRATGDVSTNVIQFAFEGMLNQDTWDADDVAAQRQEIASLNNVTPFFNFWGIDGGNSGGGDRTKPTVKILAPKNVLVNPFTLNGTVKDVSGVSSLTVSLNGGTPVSATIGSTVGAVARWNLDGLVLENGPNTILVSATDATGNTRITSKSVNYRNVRAELAGVFTAILRPNDSSGTFGVITLKVATTGIFTGKIQIGSLRKSVIGVLRNDGAARFKPVFGDTLTLDAIGEIGLSVDEVEGLNGALRSSDGTGRVLADFQGLSAPYSSKNPVPPGILNQPLSAPSKAVYQVAFLSKEQMPAMDLLAYPQSDGSSVLTLKKTGATKIVGVLADGTKFTTAGALRADHTMPLFIPLYSKRGAMIGELELNSGGPEPDVTGTDLLWFRPNQSLSKNPPANYPSGWPTGITVDALGSKYVKPASLNSGQAR